MRPIRQRERSKPPEREQPKARSRRIRENPPKPRDQDYAILVTRKVARSCNIYGVMSRPSTVASELLAALRNEGRPLIDLQADRDLLRSLTPDPSSLLYRLHKKGLAHPLQGGRFAIELNGRPSPRPRFDTLDPLAEALLRRLSHPYLISWHSALWRHDLIDQQSMTLQVAVTVRKRSAIIGRARVHFVTVAERKFFGEDRGLRSRFDLSVAAPEKALLDSIQQPRLSGGMATVIGALSTAWQAGRIDPELLVAWALRFRSPVLNRRLGFFMDHLAMPGADGLLAHLGRKHAVRLSPDPAGPHGSADPKWRVYADPVLLAAALTPR